MKTSCKICIAYRNDNSCHRKKINSRNTLNDNSYNKNHISNNHKRNNFNFRIKENKSKNNSTRVKPTIKPTSRERT